MKAKENNPAAQNTNPATKKENDMEAKNSRTATLLKTLLLVTDDDDATSRSFDRLAGILLMDHGQDYKVMQPTHDIFNIPAVAAAMDFINLGFSSSMLFRHVDDFMSAITTHEDNLEAARLVLFSEWTRLQDENADSDAYATINGISRYINIIKENRKEEEEGLTEEQVEDEEHCQAEIAAARKTLLETASRANGEEGSSWNYLLVDYEFGLMDTNEDGKCIRAAWANRASAVAAAKSRGGQVLDTRADKIIWKS